MVNVTSNVKLSSSGNVPTTGTLQKGYMAFGNFGGENKLYGNIGSDVVDLIGDAKTVLYFASQSELDEFLQGTDVPVGEWYAAIADLIYEEYGEWAAYKITFEEVDGVAYKPTFTQIGASSNGNAFYNLVPNESGIFTDGDVFYWFDGIIDTINMGNYAHTRYFLYSTDGYSDSLYGLDIRLRSRQKDGNAYSVDLNQDDFILEDVGGAALKASINYSMDNYTGNPGIDAEDKQYFTMWQGCSGDSAPFDPLYLVLKEIRSEGKPWINWNEILALDSGEESEPTESYVMEVMPSESSLDVTGTITLRQIIDGENNG